jgi:glycosyltransferase involved in cell wall biosynthesis
MFATTQAAAIASDLERPHQIDLSVVIPCLNEARTIATCVRKAARCLQELDISSEIIVADNGSSDGSAALAESYGAKVISVWQRGYGSALQGGIAAAKGRYVIVGDADDSYDFAQLEPFVARLWAGHDLVVGNRFQGGILPGAALPLFSRLKQNRPE